MGNTIVVSEPKFHSSDFAAFFAATNRCSVLALQTEKCSKTYHITTQVLLDYMWRTFYNSNTIFLHECSTFRIRKQIITNLDNQRIQNTI